MTNINNKFVPVVAPKTYEVRYTEQQEQQKPKLSLAARQKIVNRGNSYLSFRTNITSPSYGPCYVCDEDKTTNGKLTAEFKMACPAEGCSDKVAGYWHHNRSGCENSRMLITNKGYLSCGGCTTGYNMTNWEFKCSNHPADYKPMSQDSWEKAMGYALFLKNVNTATKQLNVYVTNHPEKFGFKK